MFDLLTEGFTAIRLACTLAVLVPGIAPVLLARNRAWVAAVTFTLSAGLVGWARFADLFLEPPNAVVLVALAVVLAGALVALYQAASSRLRAAWAVASGAMAGLIAGWSWVPCVGEHLAEPLNRASTDRLGTIGPIMVYVVGVSLPLLVAAALPYLWPRLSQGRDHEFAKYLGLTIGIVVAFAIAAGFYGDIIVALAPEVV